MSDRFSAVLASIIGSLAWPVLIGGVVYYLHRPVLELLPKLTMMKTKDFEFHFEQMLAKAEDEAAEVPPPDDPLATGAAEEPPRYSLRELSNTSPIEVLLSSWGLIENTVRDVARAAGITPTPAHSMTLLVSLLNQRNILPEGLRQTLRDLREMRNIAVHESGPSISKEQAERYSETARLVVSQLLDARDGFLAGEGATTAS